MANYYCEGSSVLPVPEEKREEAQKIIDRCVASLENDNDEGYVGCAVSLEREGVWFHSDESYNTDHVEYIARELINELEIDEPFYCSWTYACSKPRIDAFGGGAFVIKRGYETYYADAASMVAERCEKGLLTPEQNNDRCPECGSVDHLEGGPVGIDSSEAWQEVRCTACNAAWIDGYAFRGRDIREHGDQYKESEEPNRDKE
jgi:hypothetical protein